MEDIVLELEKCQHLQKLGLDIRDAKFMWIKGIYDETTKHRFREMDWEWHIEKLCFTDPEYPDYYNIPAYTLQEVWDKLPDTVIKDGKRYVLEVKKHSDKTVLMYSAEDDKAGVPFLVEESGEKFIDGAYKMLCFVIEEEFLKIN